MRKIAIASWHTTMTMVVSFTCAIFFIVIPEQRAFAAGNFCALEVEMQTADGKPAQLTNVRVEDPSGKRIVDDQIKGAMFRLCDFGFGPHTLIVGSRACYQSRISGIRLRMGHPIRLRITVNNCPPDIWNAACRAYLRIQEESKSPLAGSVATFDSAMEPVLADEFGRLEIFLGVGKSTTISISKQGYTPSRVPLDCKEGEEIERSIVLRRRLRQ